MMVSENDIAIIGMSCHLPGSDSIAGFWERLKNGVDCISTLSKEELEAEGIPRGLLDHPDYVKRYGLLENTDRFDASFFGFSPAEAEAMDPQHRLFMECCWESLEVAGYDPFDYQGLIGLYAGCGMNQYLIRNILNNEAAVKKLGGYAMMILNMNDSLTTRTAYKLNLKGPAVTLQTACSTSLVAVHYACQSLLNGESDMALAGGVSINPQKEGYLYHEGMIASPDGYCRAFDAKASGTAFGSGAAVVALKLAEHAIEDKDIIYAIIKGSAVNNDGDNKAGYTAPGVEGQKNVIREALENAAVHPREIGYVEAHGTATKLGDPIEIEALTQAFGSYTDKRNFCRIGSVKTNIGHTDTAAGCAGLIKTVLALHHRQIPASLHYSEPNPHIDFEQSPFFVNAELTDWIPENGTRKAGVSSFGIGGTNAHVIVEEAPEAVSTVLSKQWHLILLSARNEEALIQYKERLKIHLEENPRQNIGEIAYTLQKGRRAFERRFAVLCRSRDELIAALARDTHPYRIGDVRATGDSTANTEKISHTVNAWLNRQGKLLDKENYEALVSSLTMQLQKLHPEIDPRNCPSENSEARFLYMLARLWLGKTAINWGLIYTERPGKVPLPTYPFQRQRYWITPAEKDIFLKTSEPQSLPEKLPPDRWFYRPVWRVKNEVANEDDGMPKNVLVFMDDHPFHHKFISTLEQKRHTIFIVRQGERFREGETYYTIDPGEADHYDLLLNSLRNFGCMPDHIVHLWNLTLEASLTDSIEKAQATGFYSMVRLAQSIGRLKPVRRIALTVFSNNMQYVTGKEALNPAKATLIGPCGVMSKEYSNIRCRSIDIALPRAGTEEEEVLLERLCVSLNAKTSDHFVAYRQGKRYVQDFEALPSVAETSDDMPLREKGVYLITGGLGGIGLTLARYLAETVSARLVLIGRTPLPPRSAWRIRKQSSAENDVIRKKIAEITQLEALGAEVLYVQANVANYTEMERAIGLTNETFGQIHGVIHAAGVPAGGLLQYRGTLQAEKTFAPKLKGALIIDELLKDTPLDFYVLCSSLTAVLKTYGQADYISANAFLDAFAHYRNGTKKVISVNWDSWKDVGMAAEAMKTMNPGPGSLNGANSSGAHHGGNALRSFFEENIRHGMTPEEGVEVFKRILNGDAAQLITSTIDLQHRMQRMESGLGDLTGKTETSKIAAVRHQRPALTSDYVAPQNETTNVLAAVWEQAFGIDKIGVNDDFFELGGDSLFAINLIEQINGQLECELDAGVLMEYSTIAELATYITQKVPGSALPFCLVLLQKGDTGKPPLFLVHPVGGTVYFYRDMVAAMNSDRTIYGIQAQSLDGKTACDQSIEAMADRYVNVIRQVKPRGPYILGGSSFGGTVAYQMAQQFTKAGEEVKNIFLIDTPGPGYFPKKLEGKKAIVDYMISMREEEPPKMLKGMNWEEKLAYLEEQSADQLDHFADQPELFLELFRINSDIMRDYQPETYDGNVIFFAARSLNEYFPRPLDRAWTPFVNGNMDIIRVRGNHISVNQHPNVHKIGRMIRAYIDEE